MNTANPRTEKRSVSSPARSRRLRFGLCLFCVAVFIALHLGRVATREPVPEPSEPLAAAVLHDLSDPSRPVSRDAPAGGAPPSGPYRSPARRAAPPAPASAAPEPIPDAAGFTVEASTPLGTELSFVLGAYDVRETMFRGRRAAVVSAAGGRRLKRRDYPALPRFRSNLIVPTEGSPRLRVVDADYEELACADPIPSAGFVSRAQGAAAPARFGPFYRQDTPFPSDVARLTEPYMIRHVKGVGVIMYPFQYFPSRGVLRVYTRVRLKIVTDDARASDSIEAHFPAAYRNSEFRAAARLRFANFPEVFRAVDGAGDADAAADGLSAPASERLQETPDALLIIVPLDLIDDVSTFVAWKRQRGLAVSVAVHPWDTGNSPEQIAAYIQARAENIAYVIIVGDAPDVPVHSTSSIPSDTLYTRTSGDDYYHDLLISRICASDSVAVRNQLTKIVNYEKDPDTVTPDWYARACMVASNEGARSSAFGLNDKDLLDLERDKLFAFGYTQIDQIYDPGATADRVIDAWNAGRGIIYYLGHGSETGWNTSGFDVVDAHNQLHNGTSLPFVLNGNCMNGNFTRSGGDCLAEAMIKTGTSSQPAGAAAVIAATTSMDWDPPIVMLQAFTGYLTDTSPFTAGETDFTIDTQLTTAGGLAFFSVQRAMDYCYATVAEGEDAALKIMKQTHLFGDCTMGVRALPPFEMLVTHPPEAVPFQPFTVTVTTGSRTSVPGATVCLYRASDVQLVAKTDANGQAVLQPNIESGGALMLTVYHPNGIPYQDTDVPVSDGSLGIYSQSVLPVGFVGEQYSFTASAGGGTQPYVWGLGDDAPGWLAMNAGTGTLSGTAAAAETLQFTIKVTDADDPPVTATQTVTLTTGAPVTITTTELPEAAVGTAYEHTVAAQGSFAPFVFALETRSLPPGLDVSDDGVISGVPTLAGNYTFNIIATDQQARTDTRPLQISVTAADTIGITTRPALSDAERGVAYSTFFSATGGSGSGFTWTKVSGTLPPGLTLTPTGTLAGTPTLEGDYAFTLQVADDQEPPSTAQKGFTLAVFSDVYFPTTDLPGATVDEPYVAQIPVGGSYGPFEFSEPELTGYTTLTGPSSFTADGELQPWRTATYETDEEWELDFGFDFPFFGNVHTSCRVGNNGYLILGGASPDPKYDATVAKFANFIMIAPFWTDLVIAEGYPDTGIFVTQEADKLTVRWRGLDYHFVSGEAQNPNGTDDIVNVAVSLFANGRIEFHYGSIQTSNRVIAGICNGSSVEQELLYSHVWNASAPDYVTGWSEHDDIILALPENLPYWLTLQADGQLSGTPPAAGTYTFTVKVADDQDNVAMEDLTLTVGLDMSADTNEDGQVDNAEVLAYIELWAGGTVSQALVENAIQIWRSGGSRGASIQAPSSTLPEQPAAEERASGEIRIVTVRVDGRGELDALARQGFEIDTVAGDTVTIYATPAEVAQLELAGYSPAEIGRQPNAADVGRGIVSRVPAGYHDYAALTAALNGYADDYPDITSLVSLGQSVHGREIWALKISDNPAVEEDEPEVKYVSSIHGDESLVTELCMLLIDNLLFSYGRGSQEEQRITALIDSTEIWIVPSMNPDGLDAVTRHNANGKDLNRSFPDGVETELGTVFAGPAVDTSGEEPEIAAVMQWSAANSFVLSAGLHTGAVLTCYPYGNNAAGQSVDTPTPDDLLFEELSLLYSAQNPGMYDEATNPGLQNEPSFVHGIINAADWYVVTGEMPDWMYRYCGTLEVTLELSLTKQPAAGQIPGLWDANRESMLAYLEACHIGVRGLVTDAVTGAPVWAQVDVRGIDHAVYTDADVGDYHRPLLPGTYTLDFSAPGYLPTAVANVAVGARAGVRVDVELSPIWHTATRAFTEPRWVPAEAGEIGLSVDIVESVAPNAFVITETLPDAWSYVAASTFDANSTQLDEPRVDGRDCSWLFWGDSAVDVDFSYQALAAADARTAAEFDGQLQTAAGTVVTDGETVWYSLEPAERLLQFRAGWNLFSISIVPDDPTVAALFQDLDNPEVWGWNGLFYYPVTELQTKQGYWIYCDEAAAILIVGQTERNTMRTFFEGWNLFGSLADRSLLVSPNLVPPTWGWDEIYEKATELYESCGYWTYSSIFQVLDLSEAVVRP